MQFLNGYAKINKLKYILYIIYRAFLYCSEKYDAALSWKKQRRRVYMKEVMKMAMQELAQIAAAEEQARAICEQARTEAAEMAVQAEKDGAARLNAVISGVQAHMREAKRQAGQQAAAFETDLNSKTAAQCRALEQAAASRSGAAAAMIVERIWDSEWQS